MDDEKTCLTCVHKHKEGDTARCRLNPPQVIVLDVTLSQRVDSVFPQVGVADFCSHYRVEGAQ